MNKIDNHQSKTNMFKLGSQLLLLGEFLGLDGVLLGVLVGILHGLLFGLERDNTRIVGVSQIDERSNTFHFIGALVLTDLLVLFVQPTTLGTAEKYN